jgi:hypothetical protein
VILSAKADRKLSMVITSLKQAIATSKIYDKISVVTIEGQMIKERLGLLLGESYVKVNKSDASMLMQTMWISRSSSEFEDLNEAVSLDATLAKIKSLLKK